MRNRIVPTSRRGHLDLREDSAVEAPASSVNRVEQRRGARHETDGGVRIAGGRVGEAVGLDTDQFSTSKSSTLPPPYSSHFGEI